MSDSLQPPGLCSPWNAPGQNTRVGSLCLLPGNLPNPGLLHCRWNLYQLSHRGSPRIVAWVAYPFSSGSSQPRNWTGISCIAGGFFTNWAIGKPFYKLKFTNYEHGISKRSPVVPKGWFSFCFRFASWLSYFRGICTWTCHTEWQHFGTAWCFQFTRVCVYEGSQLGSATCG